MTGTAIAGVGGTSGPTGIGGTLTIDGGVMLPPTTSGLICGAGISTRTGSDFGPSGGASGSVLGGATCTLTIDGGVTLPLTTLGLTCGAGISTRTGSGFGPSIGARSTAVGTTDGG